MKRSPFFVAQDAAFTAHRFRHQNALHTRRPDHPGGMELDKLHVEQLRARVISQRHAVAGVLPRVRSHAIRFADAAGSHHHGFCFEHDKAALLAPVAECADNALAVSEQADDGALHEDVKAHLHAAILQRADHLQAGAVANVAKTLKGMAAEGALQDVAIRGAIKKRAPLLQFANAFRRFLGV